MTLKDIAEKAGVSISTVSRVLNGKNSKAASLDVQDRIRKLAAEYHYSPNRHAQGLKRKADPIEGSPDGRTIGCIFGRVTSLENDPFFSIIAQSIKKEANRKGYIMDKSLMASEFEDESMFLRKLKESRRDGIVILGRLEKNFYSLIREKYAHVVYTGLNSIHPDFDQIVCDGYSAALTAVHYLYKLGHRRIGYIGEKSNEARYKGYYEALIELDLEYDKDNVFLTRHSSDYGYSAIKSLLNKSPLKATAFFCANDLTAIGVIQAMKDEGIRIPEDVSVIGIDDIVDASLTIPSLTTIHIPLEEMGRTAAMILIDRLENGTSLPLKVELPYTLVHRESCDIPHAD